LSRQAAVLRRDRRRARAHRRRTPHNPRARQDLYDLARREPSRPPPTVARLRRAPPCLPEEQDCAGEAGARTRGQVRGERVRVVTTYSSVGWSVRIPGRKRRASAWRGRKSARLRAPCSSWLLTRLRHHHHGLARQLHTYALADAEDASFVLGRQLDTHGHGAAD